MALKRCIYGVDLNPLAVELAKMSLWLHSFTVGAPLSFLDHHLRCGDSLVGGWLAQTAEDIRTSTDAFAGHVFASVSTAAEGISAIEQLGDADIAEVKESGELFRSMQGNRRPGPSDAQLLLRPALDGGRRQQSAVGPAATQPIGPANRRREHCRHGVVGGAGL